MVPRDNQKRDQAMLPRVCLSLLQIIQPQIIITGTQQMPSVRHAHHACDGAASLREPQRPHGFAEALVETIFLNGAVPPPGVEVVPVGAPGCTGTPRGNPLLWICDCDWGGGAAVPDPDGAVDGGG